MPTKTKTKKEVYWRCKKCLHAEALAMEGGDEHEFYACPVASPDSIEDPRLRRDSALLFGVINPIRVSALRALAASNGTGVRSEFIFS